MLGLIVFAMLYLIGDVPQSTPNGLTDEPTLINKLAGNAHNTITRILFRVSLLVGAAWVMVFAEAPMIIRQLVASLVVGSLLRSFGQHYVGYCTASPMRRNAAWALRHNCDLMLRGIAA